MMRMDSLAPLSAFRPAWLSLLVVTLYFIGGLMFIGPMMGLLALTPFVGTDLQYIQEAFTSPTDYPELRTGILLFQGFNSLGAFIIAPLLYLIMADKVHPRTFFSTYNLKATALLLCVVLTIFFMQVNGFFIEWNANMTLPESFGPIETWMKSAEDTAIQMTEYLTTFNSVWYFLLTVLVLAVVPAIGEELLFRGLFQNLIGKWFGNIHVGIWVSAVLFSAVHFQFYGFVPRLLLGALFGYLYLWSGSLIYAMVGHFINNFLSLLALYLVQTGVIDVDFSATETLSASSYIVLTVIAIACTLLFTRQFAATKSKSSWEVVFSSPEAHRAQMVNNILQERGLRPVMVNKKESAYGTTGEFEVSVSHPEAVRALQIIQDDIEL